MWNRKKAEDFIEKAKTLGSVPGLSNIRYLMKELGDVQEKLSVIHVAGTNGKGSTCAMLERILRVAGYRTGRYSSPAVFCPEEKYQVNGIYINKEEFTAVLGEVAAACERMTAKGLSHPTLFEIETAVAFLWFYRKECQVVILETGMGGRLDATNIIRKPLCSVITSVSMDHMAFLGDTIEQIAEEKAGIIKEDRPVVTAGQQPQVYEVLQEACQKNHTNLVIADTQEIANVHYEDEYLIFDWEHFQKLRLSLLGAYQPENAICAIKTVYCLNGLGFCISDDTIRVGLKTVAWPGRFEIVNRKPLTVLDGAHNEDAAKKLRKTLEMGFTNRKIIYIIGVLADKEHEKMLRCLLPLAERVYTVTPDNPRALPGELLCAEAGKYHEHVECSSGIREAYANALTEAERFTEDVQPSDPMILAFGSLSYLGELKRVIEEMKDCII